MFKINLLILLLILIFFILISLYMCNMDIMSPLTLSFASFALVTVVAFFYNGFSGSDISFFAVFLIISTLIVFMIGFTVSSYGMNLSNHNTRKKMKAINIRLCTSFVILIMMIIGLILNAIQTLNIARSIVPYANFFNMMEYARSAVVLTEVDRSFFISILGFFCAATGYFYTYIVINNIIVKSKTKKVVRTINICIILLSLLIQMMGTGRTFLIKYLTVSIIMYYYMVVYNQQKNKINFSIMMNVLKKIIIILIIFFVGFQAMGLTTNKTQKNSVKTTLYLYSGAAIVAFDKSLYAYDKDDRFFGEESFYGLYGTLNALGIKVPNNILHLDFVQVNNNLKTNIYTSLRTYLYDFGYIGMFIVQFILGIVLGVFYRMLKMYGKNPIFILIYGFLIYGVIMQGVEEIQLRNFMSLTNIFTVFFYYVLYLILIRKIKIRC